MYGPSEGCQMLNDGLFPAQQLAFAMAQEGHSVYIAQIGFAV
jgi:hypothetical protein